MVGGAAIGVDDNLASGQTAITYRSPDHETTGGVDQITGVLGDHLGRQHRFDNFFNNGFGQFLVADGRIMLGGENDGVYGQWLAVFIVHGDLGFRVRTQPVQGAALAHFRLFFNQSVGIGNGKRHQHIGLVTGITEHQSLVARALVQIQTLAFIHALGDVRGLFVHGDQHGAGIRIESHLVGGSIANLADDVTHHFRVINYRLGGNFAGQDHHTGVDQGFAGNTGSGILRQHGIEHGIRNLVGHLVRMPFRDGLRGK